MSRLFLVRHGQASFFEDNYDRLSSLGEEQADRLGKYLSKRGLVFDEVYTGPAQRHRRTMELVGESYVESGLEWPEPTVVDDLDEHRADELLGPALESLGEKNPHVRTLDEAYRSSQNRDDIQANFQRLFETVVNLWAEGEFSPPDVESWEEFQSRVLRGVARITVDGPSGRNVLAFTSVGPISVSLKRALETSDHKSLQLGWRALNCSLSQFVFTSDRFTLDIFNSVAHLEHDEGLITYR